MIIQSRSADQHEDPLETLKKRYARGEIEQEEFEERKSILKQNK
ncbi:MAG: SHOCT domain-containing protein [Bacteroidota bacterium]